MTPLAIESSLEQLASAPASTRSRLLVREARRQGMTVPQLKTQLLRSWRFVGRPKQQPPDWWWTFWFIMAGRGFGKTLTGAQWAKRRGLSAPRRRIALVGPTLGDVRNTMLEGETGLLNVLPATALMGGSRSTGYNRSELQLRLANGTIMQAFSSEEPDRLRGPQHHYVWGEEVSSWKDAGIGDAADSTWSNMTLGLRLGTHPQACLTSTPKANKLTRHLVALAKAGTLALVHGTSYENQMNLPQAYWDAIVAPLEGTRTGRQEILAQVLDDVEGALWKRAQLDLLRVDPGEVPPLRRVVVAVDPNASSSQTADSAGIIVVGLEHRRDKPRAYVLADRTVTKGGPRAWASEAVRAYHDFDADRIVAEVNNGGEMVELTIRTVDPSVPYKEVHATRGKRVRAEPVAALYEGTEGWMEDENVRQPLAHHAAPPGELALLEDEMTTWVPADSSSPNRMDALVWGLTDLCLGKPPGYGSSSVPRGRIPGVDDRYGPGSDAVDHYR